MVDKKEIPEDMTIAEASEFWDNYSVADAPSYLVEMEYTPESQIRVVAIASDLISRLEQQAQENGVSLETLVNLWLQEKLTAVSL